MYSFVCISSTAVSIVTGARAFIDVKSKRTSAVCTAYNTGKETHFRFGIWLNTNPPVKTLLD